MSCESQKGGGAGQVEMTSGVLGPGALMGLWAEDKTNISANRIISYHKSPSFRETFGITGEGLRAASLLRC